MSVKVRIPTPLRPLVGGQAEISVAGATVLALLEEIEASHPGFKARLCDDANNLRRFINLYLNDEDIRYQDGLETPVKDGDSLSIIPAIAGGTDRSFPEILAGLKKTHREISALDLKVKQDGADEFTVIDVRESEEFRQGHIPGAVHVPRGFLEMKIEAVAASRDTPLTVYCAGGVRSLLACETLKNMGYTNLESMAGGDAGGSAATAESRLMASRRGFTRNASPLHTESNQPLCSAAIPRVTSSRGFA